MPPSAHSPQGPIEGLLAELAGRLAAQRLERNWTQTRLAEEAGISLSTLQRLEAGASVQLSHWIAVLRALRLEEALLQTIPDPLDSPIQALKAEVHKRKRASKDAEPPSASSGSWTWDDETDPEPAP